MREDCFAFRRANGRCAALTDPDCESCRFYKTRAQLAGQLVDCANRLRERGLIPNRHTENGVLHVGVKPANLPRTIVIRGGSETGNPLSKPIL